MTAIASAFRLTDAGPKPMEPVHLVGMGLMGCLTGQLLHLLGVPFTWSDVDHGGPQGPSAWRACTGVIYPSGHELDNKNLKGWQVNPWCCEHWREEARWTYYSAHPPHNGRYLEMARVGNVRVSNRVSLHINAQRMVQDLRHTWHAQRVAQAAPGQFTLVTHGFDQRTIYRWSWGWSARVRLLVPPELWNVCEQRRPALYMRSGYVLDYAYPVPGEQFLWYAGTSLITQRKPRALSPVDSFDRWRRRFTVKSGIEVQAAEEALGAWRPMPQPDAPLLIQLGPSEWAIRPQYGNALRHWWTTAAAIIEWLPVKKDWTYELASREDA